jgi:ubiquinone/menaquinone biosynthesis C-methylase UbiE
MDNYFRFATIYDLFMLKEIPYDTWAAYIADIIKETVVAAVADTAVANAHAAEPPVVLDLACGTGNITLRLATLGFDMIGVDASEDMLAQAQSKAAEQNLRILWLAQDMRELDLYGTVDAAVCTCDGLNYILTVDELKEVFRRVRLFLHPRGVFIFDMNTVFKFKEILGNGAFADVADGAEYQWDNHYDPLTGINTYRVTFQTRDDIFMELHRQRAYDPAEVCNWLLESGFSSVAMRDNYSDMPPSAAATRVTFICR